MTEDGIDVRPQQSFRDNSPDALYGSILAIEASLGLLVSKIAARENGDLANSLAVLRSQAQAALDQRRVTKYGTGAGLITDGIQDSLAAVFERAPEMVSDVADATVPAAANQSTANNTVEAASGAREAVIERILGRSLDAVRKILQSSETEIKSRAFILDRIREFGIPYNEWQEMWQYQSWRNAIDYGLMQIPTEFADYLMMLTQQPPIRSAIEVGVWRGAASYLTCAVLQRLEPKLEYHMVDVTDDTLAFDQFSEHLNLVKHIPATSLDFEGREFDLVFIDGDHSYGGVQKDFLAVGRHARRVVAFHDIFGHEFDHLAGGPVRFWTEFRMTNAVKMMICEFMHSQTPWMGIGMGIRLP